MRRYTNIVGEDYGGLHVLEKRGTVQRGTKSESMWLCRCSCGAEVEVRRGALVSGAKRYCSIARHGDDFKAAVSLGKMRRG